MLALLVLAAVASASAIPAGEKKILSIYEVPLVSKTDAAEVSLKSSCVDDCPQYVLGSPVFVMKKGSDDKMIVRYLPLGLNSLDNTCPIKQKLMDGNMVALITPLAKFPIESFPAVANMIINSPEYNFKFSSFYKQAPVMIFLTEEEFKEMNKMQKGFIHLADLAFDDSSFNIYKEYPLTRSDTITVDSKKFWEDACFRLICV